ncbi:MAG: CPBP family intramembrane metalloprotease [Myxococcales bacterium]|nr:CPBP family intramembrane metalloprotease [Myxococcales bacterium]MCB9522010.1 CPBP family intramembrane metalloprotease [Myxococcales bacterium]
MARNLILLYVATTVGTVLLQLALGAELGPLVQLAGRWTAGGLSADLALGVGVGVAVVLTLRWAAGHQRWAQRMDADFREMVAPLEPRDAFGLAAMSALAEELLFRGLLQPRIGLVAVSLVFGLLHLPNTRSRLPWPIMAVVMGFVFGGLFEWRGNLVVPVTAHFVINYFNLHDLLRPLLPEEA